jgi:DNA replication and repair protein RecF
MFLTHLSLTDFRIFSRFDHDVPRKALILAGDNAQGKTSLLEAVYYLSTLDSFQATNSVDLINFSALQNDIAVCRIVGEFQRENTPHRIEIRIIREHLSNGKPNLRKEVLFDNSQVKINEAIGQFNAVLFLPQMLQIATGSPQRRRHYLNLTLAQVDTTYNEFLSDYNKALTQRNALLKQLNEKASTADQLAFWDEKITQAGSYLIHSRIKVVNELTSMAAAIHQELTRGEDILRLSYLPAYDPCEIDNGQLQLPLDSAPDRTGIALSEIQDGFREKIHSLRSEEIARGVTTIGPHRDDLRLICNGIDLGKFGSRGQLRTALLAIKLAEVLWLKEKTSYWPVLLLDEVLAELDDYRRQDLLDRLLKTDQSLLTTTDTDLFTSDFKNSATKWTISGGELIS